MRDYRKTPEKFRKEGENTHGKGRHRAHKVGERISFKTPKGRTSGKIIAVHKEFYNVVNKNTEYKVNRNSILYSMGTRKISDGQNLTPTHFQPYRLSSTTPTHTSTTPIHMLQITDLIKPYNTQVFVPYKMPHGGDRPIDQWGRRTRFNSRGQLVDSHGRTGYFVGTGLLRPDTTTSKRPPTPRQSL